MKASSNLPRHALAPMRLLAVLCLGLSLAACSGLGRKDDTQPRPGTPGDAPALPDKGDPQARFDAALSQWKQNQIAEAEAELKALTVDFPEFSGPWTNLGILYAKSNRRDAAVAALSTAATLNPKNDVAFNWLGILNREAGQLERARLAYLKALDANPDSALAHYNLAILLDAHLKQPDAALAHYAAYQRLAGKQDLKVMAWVAEIEARQTAADPAPAHPTPEATP